MSIEALFQRNGMEWDVKENHLKHAIVFNLWYKKKYKVVDLIRREGRKNEGNQIV